MDPAAKPDRVLQIAGLAGNLRQGSFHGGLLRAATELAPATLRITIHDLLPVPLYNAVHRFWAPAVLAGVSLALMDPAWLAGGLAWSAHIAFDRSLGFGLRTRDGFQRA